jgi:hypothetical protein
MAAALRAYKTFIPVATETLRNIFFFLPAFPFLIKLPIFTESSWYKAAACECQSLVFPHKISKL